MIRYQDLVSWCEMQDLQPPVARRRAVTITLHEAESRRQLTSLTNLVGRSPTCVAHYTFSLSLSSFHGAPACQLYTRAELGQWLADQEEDDQGVYEIREDVEGERTVIRSPRTSMAADIFRYLASCDLIHGEEFREAAQGSEVWLTTITWSAINRRQQPA